MNRRVLRTISVLLLIAMFIGFVPETELNWNFLKPARAHAEAGADLNAFSLPVSELGREEKAGNWRYALREDDGYAVVTGYTGTEVELSVPASLGGKAVVGLASGALRALRGEAPILRYSGEPVWQGFDALN